MSGLKFICSGKIVEFKLYMGYDALGVDPIVGLVSARSGEFIKSEAADVS